MLQKQIIFFAFFLITLSGASQDLILENGMYCTTDGEPFTGVKQQFYESGTLESVYNFKNGLLQEEVITYYPDGSTSEIGFFDQNKRVGTWKTFHSNGTVSAIASFDDGKKNGAWRIYDQSGLCRLEMFYDQGIKIGHWTLFDEFAQVIDQKYFED